MTIKNLKNFLFVYLFFSAFISVSGATPIDFSNVANILIVSVQVIATAVVAAFALVIIIKEFQKYGEHDNIMKLIVNCVLTAIAAICLGIVFNYIRTQVSFG